MTDQQLPPAVERFVEAHCSTREHLWLAEELRATYAAEVDRPLVTVGDAVSFASAGSYPDHYPHKGWTGTVEKMFGTHAVVRDEGGRCRCLPLCFLHLTEHHGS